MLNGERASTSCCIRPSRTDSLLRIVRVGDDVLHVPGDAHPCFALLAREIGILPSLRTLTDAAEHAKDLRTALTDCRAIGNTLELLGKVSGQLTSQLR
jgi:hypothetical protein